MLNYFWNFFLLLTLIETFTLLNVFARISTLIAKDFFKSANSNAQSDFNCCLFAKIFKPELLIGTVLPIGTQECEWSLSHSCV